MCRSCERQCKNEMLTKVWACSWLADKQSRDTIATFSLDSAVPPILQLLFHAPRYTIVQRHGFQRRYCTPIWVASIILIWLDGELFLKIQLRYHAQYVQTTRCIAEWRGGEQLVTVACSQYCYISYIYRCYKKQLSKIWTSHEFDTWYMYCGERCRGSAGRVSAGREGSAGMTDVRTFPSSKQPSQMIWILF